MAKVINTWGKMFGKKSTGDTVKDAERNRADIDINLELWTRARQAWMNWQSFRDRRHKVQRYIHGDQWGDIVEVTPGVFMTERQRIIESIGAVPIQSNYMFKYFTVMKGIYSKSFTLPTCFARQENADQKSTVMTNTLQTNCDNDNIQDIFTQQYAELLVGGMSVVCEEWSRIGSDEQEDSHTFEVNPDYVGIEHGGNDSQMRDITLFVEIRDYTPEDLATELSNENGKVVWTYNQIKSIYGKYLNPNNFDYDTTQVNQLGEQVTWDTPRQGYCRTYRIWTREKRLCYHVVDVINESKPLYKILVDDKEQLESIQAENIQRLEIGVVNGMSPEDIPLIEVDVDRPFWDDYYFLQILTPDARVLLSKENPFEHNELPYTICVNEFVDGDIIPFFWHICQQQKNYNRTLTQKDTMVQRALKDLKMIPLDCVPSNMSPRQFADQFKVIGGTIFYKPSKQGNLPQIISSNSHDVGLTELLGIYRNDMEEITNESNALQGQSPSSGTSASRYALETENSTTSISSILNKFNSFEKKVYSKKMANIQQYYTSKRDVIPSQSNGYSDFSEYDPKEVGDIKFQIKITRGMNTPLARMQEDALADQLLAGGAISPAQRVELGYVPNKAKFLQVLNSNQEVQQQGAEQ